MKLTLKGFSQDVNIENPDEILYFLVFDSEGSEFKLLVQKDTTEALINLIYSNGDADGLHNSRNVAADMDEMDFETTEWSKGGGSIRGARGERSAIQSSSEGITSSEEESKDGGEGPNTEEDIESL